MMFAVIAVTPGLRGADRARAIAGAPPFTAAPGPYEALLAGAGFQVLAREDVTAAFADVVRRDLAAYEARADRVVAAMGSAELEARLTLRRERLSGIAAGLLRRETFVVRPHPGSR